MANLCLVTKGAPPRVTVMYQPLSPEECRALDPSVDGVGYVLLSPTEFIQLRDMHDATMVPFDYAAAAALFAFFFSFTVGCWFVAKNFGLVISAVKRF